MNRTEYFKLRKEYSDEIAMYKQRLGWYKGNQTLIAHYSYLLVATEACLEELEAIGYDDNDVYRTGERQLDTRIDGCSVLAGGQLRKSLVVGANKHIVAIIKIKNAPNVSRSAPISSNPGKGLN